MAAKVVVVDYGIGNLLSVTRAFAHVGAVPMLSTTPREIVDAERLVLPGVGAFGNGMAGLITTGLADAVLDFAQRGRPFLGICLGMQMMLDSSEEFGIHKGLGLIPGKVVPVPPQGIDGRPHKIPHIGWNKLLPCAADWRGTMLDEMVSDVTTYFVHSFMANPTDARHRLADCEYDGQRVAAVIRSNYLYGCQFHPEKSGPIGLKILENFLKL